MVGPRRVTVINILDKKYVSTQKGYFGASRCISSKYTEALCDIKSISSLG